MQVGNIPLLIQLNILAHHREKAEVFSLTHIGPEILLGLSQAESQCLGIATGRRGNPL